MPKPGDPIQAKDLTIDTKLAVVFCIIGVCIGVAVTMILLSKPTNPEITVAQPTIQFDNSEAAESINNQTAILARFYDGVYETAIAETVQEQLNAMSIQLRSDMATNIAQNTDVVEERVLNRLTPGNSYAGGVNLTPTPRPTPPCGMINGC